MLFLITLINLLFSTADTSQVETSMENVCESTAIYTEVYEQSHEWDVWSPYSNGGNGYRALEINFMLSENPDEEICYYQIEIEKDWANILAESFFEVEDFDCSLDQGELTLWVPLTLCKDIAWFDLGLDPENSDNFELIANIVADGFLVQLGTEIPPEDTGDTADTTSFDTADTGSNKTTGVYCSCQQLGLPTWLPLLLGFGIVLFKRR